VICAKTPPPHENICSIICACKPKEQSGHPETRGQGEIYGCYSVVSSRFRPDGRSFIRLQQERDEEANNIKQDRERILEAIREAGPIRKREIIRRTDIGLPDWDLRINELLLEGKVTRQGVRRDTRYALVKE